MRELRLGKVTFLAQYHRALAELSTHAGSLQSLLSKLWLIRGWSRASSNGVIGGWVEMQALRPHSDLLDQGLHFSKVRDSCAQNRGEAL